MTLPELTMMSGSVVGAFVAFRWLRRIAKIGDILRVMSVFVVGLIAGQLTGVITISVNPGAIVDIGRMVFDVIQQVAL